MLKGELSVSLNQNKLHCNYFIMSKVSEFWLFGGIFLMKLQESYRTQINQFLRQYTEYRVPKVVLK